MNRSSRYRAFVWTVAAALFLAAKLGAQTVVPIGCGSWFKCEADGDSVAFVKHQGQDVHLRVWRDGWLGPWQRANEISTAGQQDEPDVEPFSLGGVGYWAACWTDRGQGNGKTSIQEWMRVFDEDGNPVSTSRPVPDPNGWQAGTSSWLGKMAALPGGGVRVLYTRGWLERVCWTDQGVHGPLSTETVVSPLVSGDSAAGSLAVDAAGRCLVAWTEWTGPTPHLRARVDQGAVWSVQAPTAHQQHPSVAWSRTGEPVIAWREAWQTHVRKGSREAVFVGKWWPELHVLPSGRILLSHGSGPQSAMVSHVRLLGRGLQEIESHASPVGSWQYESPPDSAVQRGGRVRWVTWADQAQGFALRLEP